MKKYNTIIIGGGASGCMAVMTARDKSLAIIDSGKSLAKKLMVTGNGRCNLTNTNMSSEYFNENIDKFLKTYPDIYSEMDLRTIMYNETISYL